VAAKLEEVFQAARSAAFPCDAGSAGIENG
jgi:hypothetical protein